VSAHGIGRVVKRRGVAIALWAGSALLAGCAGPQAWDKGMLARPEMAISWNALAARFEQHIYESKEASSGGYGVGGGGCGCN
jgi:hypothetical protein